MNVKNLTYRLTAPILMVGILVLSLLCGCRPGFDPVLALADSKMEEHPDSALALLNDYRLTPKSTPADSAYYSLLLTHARYKNFIDETDDSLISVSTDYFLDHSHNEMAARALFLKGIIQMNADRLGEAAVSFRKGLDIAHQSKSYMWEGQCARGLCMLYGELHNGSAQVTYATQAHNAYLKTGDRKWILYSKYVMAKANNNQGLYEECLAILNELEKQNEDTDTLLRAQISQLKGISLFALGRHRESLQNYSDVCELNPQILTDDDRRILRLTFLEIEDDSIPTNVSEYTNAIGIDTLQTCPYGVLAHEGNYKDAYENLLRYTTMQDSVLWLIFRNNVAEAVSQYENMNKTIVEGRTTNERLFYLSTILFISVIFLISYWRFRERLHNTEVLRLKTEGDMESLRSDLMSQLTNSRNILDNTKNPIEVDRNRDYEKIIRKRYADTNRLCDSYYQDQTRKNAKKELEEEINKILITFRERPGINEIEKYVDEQSFGLYSDFKNDFFDLSEENHRLFLYLMLGFSSRTISIILAQNVSGIYNKKSRLKGKIEKSDIPEKEKYLNFF